MADISLNCPNCGADLDVDPGKVITECPYCKSDIFIGPLADRNKMSAMQQELVRNEAALQQADRVKKYHLSLKKWRTGFTIFLVILFIFNSLAFALVGGANSEDDAATGVGATTMIILWFICLIVPIFMASVYPCYDISQDKVTRSAAKKWSAFFAMIGIEAAVLLVSAIAAFFLVDFVF